MTEPNATFCTISREIRARLPVATDPALRVRRLPGYASSRCVSGQFAADRTPAVQDRLADGAPADAEPRREGVQRDGVDDHRDERALLVGGQTGVDHAADGGGGRRLLGR